MLAYGLNANRAIGLGVVLLSLNSLLLAFVHALYFGGVSWDIAAFTMLGILWGGRLGPFLAQWISPRTTKKVFAFIALLDGLIITLQASYVTLQGFPGSLRGDAGSALHRTGRFMKARLAELSALDE